MRALATLPVHEASRRLRATGCHDCLEARGPKQTKQHVEEVPAASILHTHIVIGAQIPPKDHEHHLKQLSLDVADQRSASVARARGRGTRVLRGLDERSHTATVQPKGDYRQPR